MQQFVITFSSAIEKYKKLYRGVEPKNTDVLLYLLLNPNATVEQIEKKFCIVSCPCELSYPEKDIIDIKKQCLKKRGDFYGCSLLPFVYQYFVLQKEIPTEDQLEEVVYNIASFERDPEGYHEKDKVLVPTLNLDKLSPIIKDTSVEENCSLCQTEIGNHSFYKIPPCNHLFHAEKEHCLGESNIINWLSSHKQCPNCKTIVSIPSVNEDPSVNYDKSIE
jgi:hypothetical protein